MSLDWRKAGKDKASTVSALVPEEWRLSNIPSASEQRDVTGAYIQQFLSPDEVEITETDAVGIVAHTSTGKWKSVDVAKAFCHRAAIAHQLVNCLHEIFFDQAIKTAEELDKYYAEHGKPKGPLHGLPVSLKDQFHVKGVETTMGYVGWIGTFQGSKGSEKYKTFESEMVKELRSMGAVLFVKTSVPHTLMCGETVNNIIGYTQNPTNRNLSSGGSSGGEGALMALRGSPVGFGTDIGGSIRIPAGFNGLYGLRPSVGRLPYEGMGNSMDGQNSVLSVVGPLATTIRGLRFITQAILSTKPWLHDPLVHEIPWRPEAESSISNPIKRFTEPLSFGVLRHDGACTPMPPVTRALNLVVSALENLGHETIPWDPTPSHTRLCELCYKCWGFDGGADCRRDLALSGEEAAPQALVTKTEQYDAMNIMATNIEKRDALKEYMEYWNSTAERTKTGRAVDAVIAPLAPFPAARPEGFSYYGYSVWVNTLDYSSVVVPVTKVDKAVDKRNGDFEPINETDAKTQDQCKLAFVRGFRERKKLTACCTQMIRRSMMELMWGFSWWAGDFRRRR